MIVRLSHPWRWHRTRAVLDTEGGLITEDEARALIHGGIARDVEDLIENLGGGYYVVTLSGGKTKKVRGKPAAIKALKRDGR